MNEEMKAAWLEISQMLGEPTREELDVFLRTWQRASQATREALAEQPAQQEPVAFLANGTRFKISYDSRQSGGQIHGIPPELGGRWVAFVAADDDCHLKRTSPPAQQEPVLQDIEQYRLQMAGICTAAIGYWKEGDGIHPDYDTVALRDVAKLYAKYDELYRAQSAQRTWVGLTDEEKRQIFEREDYQGWLDYINAIEAKLKEKNT